MLDLIHEIIDRRCLCAVKHLRQLPGIEYFAEIRQFFSIQKVALRTLLEQHSLRKAAGPVDFNAA